MLYFVCCGYIIKWQRNEFVISVAEIEKACDSVSLHAIAGLKFWIDINLLFRN